MVNYHSNTFRVGIFSAPHLPPPVVAVPAAVAVPAVAVPVVALQRPQPHVQQQGGGQPQPQQDVPRQVQGHVEGGAARVDLHTERQRKM